MADIVIKNIQPVGATVVVTSNSYQQQHNVLIPGTRLSITIYGVGRNGKYRKTYNIGDFAEYEKPYGDRATGRIEKILPNKVIIDGHALSFFEFASLNHDYVEISL